MSYRCPIFKEDWRTQPTGATHQAECGTPEVPRSGRDGHKPLLTTGFGDLPCTGVWPVLSTQSELKQTGQCRIGPAGCTYSFCCSRSEGRMEALQARAYCPSHLYGKQPCTMGTPSTAVARFPLPEQESSKVVSDESAAMSSATGMWMTQRNSLGIAWAGAGKKPRQNLAEKQKSRLIIYLTPVKLCHGKIG